MSFPPVYHIIIPRRIQKMKIFCLSILLVLLTSLVVPGEAISLPELKNPEKIFVDKNHIYITEFPFIYIYSLKDFSLIKKFGQRGEGPREFLLHIHLSIQPDYLMVQSRGKVSFFSLEKAGEEFPGSSGNKKFSFLREYRSPFVFREAKALDKQLVIAKSNIDRESNTIFLTVNRCNHDFSDLKEIYRVKHFFQIQNGKPVNAVYLGRGTLCGRLSPLFYTLQDKILIEDNHGETGTILIFNSNGEKLLSATHNYEQLEFTPKHKKEILDLFILKRKSRALRILDERKLIVYPEYFPPIRIFHAADNKIYVVPYKKKQDKSELHIFDMEGKLLKKVLVDLAEQDIFEFYPYAISGGKVYQLIDNEDTDDWELRIREIEK